MKSLLLLVLLTGTAFAADQTYVGWVSDPDAPALVPHRSEHSPPPIPTARASAQKKARKSC